MARRKRDSLTRDLGGIAVAGAGLGIAGGIAGAAGAPGGVSQGIGTAGSMLPLATGAVILKHTRKSFKRRRYM